jgi:hypothetical protein
MRLAERLEFARPRDIRQLIERNREELERHGSLRHHTATPSGGGPAFTEYWLNEAQALSRLSCSQPMQIDLRADAFARNRSSRLIFW